MKSFTYNDELYIRVIPGKALFRSNLIHSVVNRGDIFAVRVSDSILTIIPGVASVEHSEMHAVPVSKNAQAQGELPI